MNEWFYIRSLKNVWQRTKELQARQILSLNMVTPLVLYTACELKEFYAACMRLLCDT